MRKSRRMLLLLGGVCALALLYLGALRLTASEKADSAPIALVDGAVTALSWTFDGEDVALARTDTGWTLNGVDSAPVDAETAEAMFRTIGNLTAARTLTDADDLSAYGLDAPVCAATIAIERGEIRLEQGDTNALTGETYLLSGNQIYTTDEPLRAYFELRASDLIAFEAMPALGEATSFAIGDRVNQRWDGSVWRQAETGAPSDGEEVAALISAARALLWESVADWTGSVDLSAATRVDAAWHDGDYALLLLPEPDADGEYLGALPGSDRVYHVDAVFAEMLLNASDEKLAAGNDVGAARE